MLFAGCKADFVLRDWLSPSKKRFVFLFSAMTNFLRFKAMLDEFVSGTAEEAAAEAELLGEYERDAGERRAAF